MIYTPDTAVDRQLLSQSRELVREGMALLRSTDHLVSGQRLRDELAQERRKPPHRDGEKAGPARSSEGAPDRRSEQMRESKPGGHRQAQDNSGVR